MRTFTTLLAIICVSLSQLWAATTPASSVWPLTANGSATTQGQVTATAQSLVNMNVNGYSGGENSQRTRITKFEGLADNTWPALQLDTIAGTYHQFAIAPKAGNDLTINNLSYKVGIAGGVSTMRYRVFYSTEANFSTKTELTSTLTNVNLPNVTTLTADAISMNVTVANGKTLYVRIYPWLHNEASARSGKYLCLLNVTLSGETVDLPVASSVVWPLSNDLATYVVTGNVLGTAPTLTGLLNYGKLTYDSKPAVSVYLGTPWPAETAANETRYVQFAASPKSGGTLTVKSIEMSLAGYATNSLRASVYYSKSADFTTATGTLVTADANIPSGAYAKIGGTVDVTVQSGETLYVRMYPYSTSLTGDQWKLVGMNDVTISGDVTGVTADPPTVTSGAVSYISTTTAISGGTVTNDGGATVTERGVVYNTTGTPTIGDGKTTSGTGSGSFVTNISGLTPGTLYYIRAFATNSAGTTYGAEASFTTLAALDVPTVTTNAVSNIMAVMANGGGNVTAWGGTEVTARGICWNTTGNPTTADAKTENGTNIGAFTSILHGLNESTTYYVRAYAINTTGTGYGNEVSFTTKAKDVNVTKIVAKDGSGDYTTVQAAFDAVPDFYTGTWTIMVKPGTYYEKLMLSANKSNVVLMGEDAATTILTYDDYAGKSNGSGGTIGTAGSYSVSIDADDFKAMDITFQNTIKNDGKTSSSEQAVALSTNGDRQEYYNCRILGYQDTYYARGSRYVGRIYMKDCYLEGSVDYIFGRNVVVFDNCQQHINRNNGVITAPATEATTNFGFVFLNNTITTDVTDFNGASITYFYLGRPWQASPKSVYINCVEPINLHADGWTTMTSGLTTLFAEYNCTGAGFSPSTRKNTGRQLTDQEAATYTIANIFAKTTAPNFAFDWMPSGIPTKVTKPVAQVGFELSQNVPNPLTSSSTIAYTLSESGNVSLVLYNSLGHQVKVLENSYQTADSYKVTLSRDNLSTGIYFYVLSQNGQSVTKKLIIK
jgi:pectin methylesterase-like acyl-CoA thioesterase